MRAAQFLAIIGRGSKGSNALENTEDRAGATSEQQDNVINTVNSLDPYGPSWQLVPGNVAAGTVYAQVPTTGTGDLTFTRASTATRTNSAGNIVDVATGVPRIHYRNADGSLSSTGRLLLEPQRTNLVTFSEQFDNAAWVKTNTTITANAQLAPDGTTTADKLIATVTNALHICESSTVSFTSGTVYTFYFYAKRGESNFVQFTGSSALLGTKANFNLLNGTLGTVDSGITATITPTGNEWYRCSVTFTAGATGSYRAIICAITTASSVRFQAFAGNGTDGVFIWGAQLEAGAYPTTYIRTTTAPVTRVADILTRSNLFTNNFITASGGTWFFDLNNTAQFGRSNSNFALFLSSVDNGFGGNGFVLYNTGSPSQRLTIAKYVNGSISTLYTLTSDRTRFAIKWNGSTADFFENGVKVISATGFTGTALQFIGNQSLPVPININQSALFPIPLTDAQCIQLTTL